MVSGTGSDRQDRSADDPGSGQALDGQMLVALVDRTASQEDDPGDLSELLPEGFSEGDELKVDVYINGQKKQVVVDASGASFARAFSIDLGLPSGTRAHVVVQIPSRDAPLVGNGDETAPTAVREIIDTHHRSLRHLQTGSRGRVWRSYLPASVAAIMLVAGQLFTSEHLCLAGAGRGLLSASALLSGVLFGVCITMLSKAVDLDIDAPTPSAAVTRSAQRLQALSASALYSVLLSGLATGVLIVGELIPAAAGYTTAIAVVLLVQVATIGVIVTGRVFRDTQWRSDRARTGASLSR